MADGDLFPNERTGDDPNYVVVARRYRPQTFAELLGQEHVAKALAGAIQSNRVGHAYLFTGARGVGKTSAARILAKCLDCVNGPTITPCNQCDVCEGVSSGHDMDVLEIDGASNRGIDEIRELRQNVNVRPSRARYKIYIIDEVHMLTTQAFNALLKTLEEPPEHVKFIFCTTEADKIPITILSRCQRFDFAGIETRSIAARLAQIAESEGVEAEPEALAVLARRAAGSMRDSQSLLEQLLSFGGQTITVDDVQRLLGTVGDERLGVLVEHIVGHDAAAALMDLDQAFSAGIDPSLLMDQLLGYLRDLLTAAAGCGPDVFRFSSTSQQQLIVETGARLGCDTVLAMMQIVEQALAKMRYSTYGRTLAELAVVRLARLENMASLSELLGRMRAGDMPAAADNKKKASHEPGANGAGSEGLSQGVGAARSAEANGASCSPRDVLSIWRTALAGITDSLSMAAGYAHEVRFVSSNRLAAVFSAQYDSFAELCRKPDKLARLEKAVSTVAGQPLRLEIEVVPGTGAIAGTAPEAKTTPRASRLHEAAQHPFVLRAIDLFDAEPVGVEESASEPD